MRRILGRFLGLLLKTHLPLTKNILKYAAFASSVGIPIDIASSAVGGLKI